MITQTLARASQHESRADALYSPQFLEKDPLQVSDYSPNFLSQDLNNEACALIDRNGNITQAIQILEKALELSKLNLSDEDGKDEPPKSIGEHSRFDSIVFHEDESLRKKRTEIKRRIRLETPSLDDQEEERFIHRELLRVNTSCPQERNYMGIDLTVMILFNLAIAHQLLAISLPTTDDSLARCKVLFFERALRLYELCIFAHNQCNCSDAAGLRLKMLVMNNLGEIHRVSGNGTKHQMCLKYMMRGVMFIVDAGHGWLLPDEIDGIYRNMQASRETEQGRTVHAGAA